MFSQDGHISFFSVKSINLDALVVWQLVKSAELLVSLVPRYLTVFTLPTSLY